MLFVLLSVSTALCAFCLFLGVAGLARRNPVAEMTSRRPRGSLAGSVVSLAGQFGKFVERSSLHHLVSAEALAQELRRSGWRLSLQEFLGVWFGCGLVGLLGGMFLLTARPGFFLFALPLPLLGFALPRFLLLQKARSQQKRLAKDFIVFVEKAAICVAAGVPLLKVLNRESEKEGPLSTELKLVVQDAGSGSLEDALRRFADRAGIEAVSDFASTVANALRHGDANLSRALLALAREMRRAREMKIEEVARKMETKIIIPIVLTVLPAAAILLLGPLAVGLVRSLRGG